MTNSTENPLCTCPSGDGSLQHPCPTHPASTNELKLGDVISVFSCHLESKNDWFVIRLCDQNDVDNYTNHIKQNEWQRGIHPSLIPKGFELVESAEFEACKECVGLSKQQNDLLKEQIGLLKQTHRLELEAAQKDLDELRIDRAMRWIPEVKRVEDMSAKGYLKIMRDGDGDVIVVVCAADGDKLKASESVEFCVGRGGNRSPNTVNALIRLAEAMEKDNAERPIQLSPKPEEGSL